MNISMPDSGDLGWGIAAKYLTREILRLPEIQGVTLHCIPRLDFEPLHKEDWNDINIGYCFFEHDILAYHAPAKALKQWDFIVTGSRWCEYHLRMLGIKNTTTILQGVDPLNFSYHLPRTDDGRFVVFSGGKFEFRKSQDIVIAAMRIFMERYPDVRLSCAWHNHWESSIRTMEQSRHIEYLHRDEPCEILFRRLLSLNGIDTSRVTIHPPLDNSEMASVYASSDLGFFPNRCEGGNNMVMSEYMACGRAVLASNMTGHADVITPENAFELTEYRPVIARQRGIESGVWFEPSVDEIVRLLERAYRNQSLTRGKGVAAALSMENLSWERSARKFHSLASHLAERRGMQLAASGEKRLAEAERFFKKGHFIEAERRYLALLKESPLDPDLLNSIGTVLDSQERLKEAVLYYSKAISLRPSFIVARYNLANTLKRLGDLDECINNLESIVENDPEFADAWQNLGVSYFETKKFTRAAECFERVAALQPDRSGCYASLAEIYYQEGTRLERALECVETALQSRPGNFDLINQKGIILYELGQYEEAETNYRKGLAIEPDNPILLSNMGNIFLARAMPEKAAMFFNLVLGMEPGNASLIFNRAMVRLQMGDYLRGWEDYELRFNKRDAVARHHSDIPLWNGESLAGKSLLVWAEQVYGDSIMFARYLPLLKKFGIMVLFECMDAHIAPMFREMPGVDAISVRGNLQTHADLQIPLGSLPRIFGTTLETIPFPGGYLRPDRNRLSAWKEKIVELAGQSSVTVGIVWGGRKPRLNSNRSMMFDQLKPLFSLSGIRWFSLQTGDDRNQLSGCEYDIIDLADYMTDFGESAAIVASLDLIITIDTAVAHLAGAVGADTWVMLKSSPDWRWLLNRNDSPWYSSATLFRQQEPGNWKTVIDDIMAALINFTTANKTLKFVPGSTIG